MFRSFADYLQTFVRSLDAISQTQFDSILKQMEAYLTNKMRVSFIEFIEAAPETGTNEVLLIPHHVTGGKKIRPQTISGPTRGHISFAYFNDKPLWIVGEDRKPLKESDKLEDCWSRSDSSELPSYWNEADGDMKTSVIVPVRHREGELAPLDAIINLESERFVEISNYATEEITRLAKAFASLLKLYNFSERNRNATQKNIDALEKIWLAGRDILKPTLFVASPANGDEKVSGLIVDIVGGFGDKIDLIYWKRNSASGDINESIRKAIGSSQYGIAYFSEPTGDEGSYKDNPNVLIEAGMMQAVTNTDISKEPTGWIPIREKQSPPMPFDFSTENILEIKRVDGKLNVDKFRSDLKERIENLLRLS